MPQTTSDVVFHHKGCISVSRLLVVGVIAIAVAFGFATLATAQNQNGKDTKPSINQKAMTILKGMSDYLGRSATISFRSRSFYDVTLDSGLMIKAGRSSRVLLKRPSHLNIIADDDNGSATTIWFDGSKLTVWRRDVNQVMSLAFKGTTDAMLDHLIDKYGAQIPLSDLFYSNAGKLLAEDLSAAEYVGIRIVDGVPCHQLAFQSSGVNWQIWIEADETPVPRRFVMDFVDDGGKPQYMTQMDSWSVGGDIANYNFVAGVPASVKKVEFKLKPEQ